MSANVRDTLDRAIAAFCDGAAVRLLARSSDYRTPPWGVTDQPPFINCAIVAATELPPPPSSPARNRSKRNSAATARRSALGPAHARHRPDRL
jgi:7,8-dihydro-6-hydroxymethylpterin-pyrophosphokinase